jgi:acetyl esterase/lipase
VKFCGDKEGKKMREIISIWQDEVPFDGFNGSHQNPTLTLHPVEGSRGAVVVCPGGGYGMLADPKEGDLIAERLNSFGISAYVLHYRILPCHHMAPLTDAKRAIRLVKNMGYEKVAIMGFSAGGHLTCSAATLYDHGNPDSPDPIEHISSRPDAFIPCYPVVSLIEDSVCEKGSCRNLLGELEKDEELRIKFSAERQITKDTPPAFIWATTNDNYVHSGNCLLLASALREKNIPFVLHLYHPNTSDHGLGLAMHVPDTDSWSAHLGEWLLRSGYGAENNA